MYIKEISQDDMRGILGLTVIMSQNVGIFIIFLMGAYLDYYVVLYILVSIPIISAALMVLAPESPVYLVKIGKIEVRLIINDDIIGNILEKMKINIAKQSR